MDARDRPDRRRVQRRGARLADDRLEARFDRAVAGAKERFPTRTSLKDAAKTITHPAARRAMYDFLKSLAASDELTIDEGKALRWLASWWQLEG